jgi:hypothetical protein
MDFTNRETGKTRLTGSVSAENFIEAGCLAFSKSGARRSYLWPARSTLPGYNLLMEADPSAEQPRRPYKITDPHIVWIK